MLTAGMAAALLLAGGFVDLPAQNGGLPPADTVLAQPGQFLRIRDPASLPNEAVTGRLIAVRGDTVRLGRLGGEQVIVIAPWSKVDVSVRARRNTLLGALGGLLIGAGMGVVGSTDVPTLALAGGAAGAVAGTLIVTRTWTPALLIPAAPDVRRLIAVVEARF
jgi:hypothetical protein